jgi:hypothetical protein
MLINKGNDRFRFGFVSNLRNVTVLFFKQNFLICYLREYRERTIFAGKRSNYTLQITPY